MDRPVYLNPHGGGGRDGARARAALQALGWRGTDRRARDVVAGRAPDVSATLVSAARAKLQGLPVDDPPPPWWQALDCGRGRPPRHSVQRTLRVLALPEIRALGLPTRGLWIRREPLPEGGGTGRADMAAWVESLCRLHYGPGAWLKLARRVEERWQETHRPQPWRPLPF